MPNTDRETTLCRPDARSTTTEDLATDYRFIHCQGKKTADNPSSCWTSKSSYVGLETLSKPPKNPLKTPSRPTETAEQLTTYRPPRPSRIANRWHKYGTNAPDSRLIVEKFMFSFVPLIVHKLSISWLPQGVRGSGARPRSVVSILPHLSVL